MLTLFNYTALASQRQVAILRVAMFHNEPLGIGKN